MNGLFPFSRITGLLLAVAIGFAPSAAGAQQSSVTVVVNGQTMSFDQPPIVRTGRVFVPLRGVFEQLGASVVYNNGQINASAGRRTVSLTIGSTQATISGKPATVDVAPFLEGDRTLVPLRFIAQALGATVNWNDANSTVTIVGGGAPAPAPRPTAPPAVRLTYQFPTGTIYNRNPQTRLQTSRPIAIGGFTVLVDGRDVSAALQNNGKYFFVPTLPAPLGVGTHRVRVSGHTVGGVPFDITYTFYQATP